MEERLFFENSKGQKICGVLLEPNKEKKEVVILVHVILVTKMEVHLNKCLKNLKKEILILLE
jgi:hypothetical protein